jgi:hypothetical protein
MSAVHLHTPETSTIHIPRKLSKRRTPALGNIFGEPTYEPTRNAVSLPATPVEHIPHSSENFHSSQLPKRMSVVPLGQQSNTQPYALTSKKEKRGSVLGRLVKKFSIMRKSTGDQDRLSGREDDWQHVNADGERSNALDTPPAPEKVQSDITKRVPPPTIDPLPPPTPAKPNGNARESQEADRSSSISLEAPFSMGRLTIANPDTPGSADTTPAFNSTPLPAESLARDSYGGIFLAYNDALERETQIPLSPQTPMSITPNAPTAQSPLNVERNYSSLPPTNGIKDAPTTSSMSASNIPGYPEPQVAVAHNSMVNSPQPAAPTSSYFHSPSTSDSQIPGPPTDRSRTYSPQTVSSLHKRPSSAESRSPHPSEKPRETPLNAPKARPPSFALSIPFPTTQPANGHHLSVEEHYLYDNSPLSAASMLANPPTPYTADMTMPTTPETPPPPLPSKKSQERKLSSREPSPNNNSTGRQTETFRLVRSSSGNVYASSETIVAGGQQWEVVESLDSKAKAKTLPKSKDLESSSRREQKRDGKTKHNTDAEIESRHRSQRRSQKRHSGERAIPTGKATPRTTSLDHHHKNVDLEPAEVRRDATRSSRKRDEDRRLERKAAEQSTIPFNVNKPQPAPPPPTPGVPFRPLQRNPSISARPTSELQSAAEMNALRAKEAWEMERLWKARSMYGDDSNALGPNMAPTNAALSKPVNTTNQDTIHGSSHTAFVVQTPFQSLPSHIYHSMPTAPPPIIFSSPSSQFTSPSNRPSQFFTPDYLSSDQRSLSPSSRPALANPLPEPPQESSYEPAPLPPSMLDIGSRRPTDYWTKYAGVATSH